MIVCSIDLMNGKAVQLRRGSEFALERDDAIALAERFGRCGEIAVIDLDAALERGENRELIERLCRIARCRVGGGIRSVENAKAYLRAGAQAVILGTAATPDLLKALPKERCIVALDTRDGRVATHGWTQLSAESPIERARALDSLCGGFLVTDIAREGMLAGCDSTLARELREIVSGTLTLAGGVRTPAEICELDRLGIDAQVGMAIYTGGLDPVDAVVELIDFEKGGGLAPTIVRDEESGAVRMLAYSNRESLREALRTGGGVYWSRSRNALWRKGESSGNMQRLARISLDCDRDAISFFVRQTGSTCHTGAATCFAGEPFSWSDLLQRIDARAQSASNGSYTRKLLGDPGLLNGKLREEADEVACAADAGELAWECADLLYFMSVKMRSAGIGISEVMAQLASRAAG
jgi:phosphoribosyl-ATP pyrophosphohydrolase/phosphoribosyl-AMP cyclohydrolase